MVLTKPNAKDTVSDQLIDQTETPIFALHNFWKMSRELVFANNQFLKFRGNWFSRIEIRGIFFPRKFLPVRYIWIPEVETVIFCFMLSSYFLASQVGEFRWHWSFLVYLFFTLDVHSLLWLQLCLFLFSFYSIHFVQLFYLNQLSIGFLRDTCFRTIWNLYIWND